jgi:8-oxo-dGTP pyrophosphatase MutT (NUDIX family)
VTARLLDSCRQTLSAWTAPTAEQDQLRRRYLDHLDDHPDGWSRSCPGAHLTASSLICADDGQVLLTLHRRIGRWLQTGGHLEAADASIMDAAFREASEESGLDGLDLDHDPLLLSEHEVPCGIVRPTLHLDVQFLIRSGPAAAPVVGAESVAVQWFRHDQLPGVDDSVTTLVQRAAARLGW